MKYGSKVNYIFGRHFARLKYFTYHLVPVLAPNYKQYILLPAEVRKVRYSLATLCHICLFEFIRVEGGATFMNILQGGASYNSFETSGLGVGARKEPRIKSRRKAKVNKAVPQHTY
jgi:hypothetical protein